jgi:hypothetical protein
MTAGVVLDFKQEEKHSRNSVDHDSVFDHEDTSSSSSAIHSSLSIVTATAIEQSTEDDQHDKQSVTQRSRSSSQHAFRVIKLTKEYATLAAKHKRLQARRLVAIKVMRTAQENQELEAANLAMKGAHLTCAHIKMKREEDAKLEALMMDLYNNDKSATADILPEVSSVPTLSHSSHTWIETLQNSDKRSKHGVNVCLADPVNMQLNPNRCLATQDTASPRYDVEHEQDNLSKGTSPYDSDSKEASYSEATEDEL